MAGGPGPRTPSEVGGRGEVSGLEGERERKKQVSHVFGAMLCLRLRFEVKSDFLYTSVKGS